MATYKTTPELLPPAAAPTENPFFGHGGSYRFDPATGQTVLLERAGETAAPAAPDPSLATPSSTPAQE